MNLEYTTRGSTLILSSENIEETLRTLMNNNINLQDMAVDSPDLEDVFLYLTGRRLRD